MSKKSSEVQLKTTNTCPVCGDKDTEKYWAMAGYRLSRCRQCSMVWDHSPPENILSQYDKTYFVNENPKGGYANYFEGMKVNKKTFKVRLQKIAKKQIKGSLLDVGCAFGDSLVEAKKLGWKSIEGIEVSDFARKHALKNGVKVHKGPLKAAKIKKKYDCILYQDVIEHITDPVGELRLAKKHLAKNGYIFLVTPDIGGFWAKIMGPLWYHFKPKEHVSYFNKKSLSMALKEAGYKNIEVSTTYHVLSLGYVFNRLTYYSPLIFESLKRISEKVGISNLSFRAYIGEFEAWAQKS